MTDPRGNSANYDGNFTIIYHYDDLNRLVKGELPESMGDEERPVVELEYDARGNLKERIDVDGTVTSYEYYPRNWVKTETISGAGKSYTSTYEYDQVGNQTHIIDMDGNTTIKEYDDLNREIEIISPEGNEERYIYDGNDNQIRYYDGKGKYTDYQYDSYNRITGVKDAMGNQSSYHYDRQGNLRKKINPLGQKEIYDYDELGRMILEENTQGYQRSYAYDAVGNRTYKRDPNGTESSYQYYPNNLVREISLSNGEESHKISYSYDEVGETKEVIDGDIISRYNYLEDEDTGRLAYTPDPYGRIYQKTDIIDGQSLSTNYRYDIAGRITGIKTPAGEWLEYEYNQLGELQSVPGFVEGTEYNGRGLLEEVKAANGLRNSYNYDNNSRIEGISYQNNNQQVLKDYQISYDEAGNIATLNNNLYQYDNLNRLIFADLEGKFENRPQGENQVKYRTLDDYDGQNSLTRDELIEDKAEIVELDYAAGSIAAGIGDLEKITRVELKGENIEHRVEERQLSVYYGTNREEFTEIVDYQFIKETIREGNEEKSKIIIIFDQPVEASYIKVKTDFNERDENYKSVNNAEFYNTAEDIIDIYYYVTERTERYEYDAAGNREKETIVDWRNSNRDYSYYSNSNQLKSNEDFAFVYDDNGNMIKRGKSYTISGDSVTIASDDECWEYQYDLLDRLIKVKENGTTVAEYAYNHRGLRVKKENYQTETYYTFNLNDQVIYEQENGEYSEYIYVRGQHFARRDGNLLSTETTTYFYHTDHLGSTVMVTDTTAEIVWGSEYTPFGLLAKREGDYGFQKAEKFTGKDLDQDIGLYYYNARWYYAEIGRFISADSYKGELENPQTLNLYIYTTNNPLIYVDPTGNTAEVTGEVSQWDFPIDWQSFFSAIGSGLSTAGKTTLGALKVPVAFLLISQPLNEGEDELFAKFQELYSEPWVEEIPLQEQSLDLEVLLPRVVSIQDILNTFPSGDGIDTSTPGTSLLPDWLRTEDVWDIPLDELSIDDLVMMNRDIKVIGRLEDTAIARNWEGHDVLNDPDWTLAKNDQWVNTGIENKQNFYIGSPMSDDNLISSNPKYPGETVFAREVRMLKEAGYLQKGDYFIHPDNIK